jgi:arylsulfatase A-like enzyme
MYGPDASPKRAAYAALITQMDEAVGALLQQLDDNTLVLFASDNGGDPNGQNGPLRAGKASLFEGGTRVPLIARWPGRIPAGRTSGEFLSTLEFLPTFLGIAGASPPRNVTLDGFDVMPVLAGKASSPRTEMFWQYRGDRAARGGRWKWVDSRRGGGLFDLDADLGETRDLSRERPDVLQHLKERWAAWRKQMDDAEPRGPFRDY